MDAHTNGRADSVCRASALLGACHPGPCLAVTAMMVALAASAGRDAGGCVLLGAAVLSGQLSVGWCNDALDADRDRLTDRSDKPIVAGRIGRRTVAVAACAALVACVPLSLANGFRAGVVQLVGVAAAWAYDLGLKATLLSWLPYAVGFGCLPAFVGLSLPGHPWPAWWAPTAGALLGVGAHLANVLPDMAGDLVTGVRGLPQRLGARRTRALIMVPMIAATALLVVGPSDSRMRSDWPWLAGALVIAAVGAVAARRYRHAPFTAAIAVAVLDVATLVWRGTAIA